MKNKKMDITIAGDDAQVLKQLSEKSGLSPSAVIGNLIKGVMARGWARCEAMGDATFFCPELQQKNERGEVLEGEELFKVLQGLALLEIREVMHLAQDRILDQLQPGGSA